MAVQNKLLFILFILSIFIAPTLASAIGASPARQSFEYRDGLQTEVNYIVRNNNIVDITAEITLGGELAKYCKLSRSSIPLGVGATGTFTVSIDIPKVTGYVGPQTIYVAVGESMPAQAGIGTRTEVIPDIIVNFPYPGKYLSIQLFNASNVNKGENSTTYWQVLSRGTEDVTFSARLDVIDKDNTSILSKSYPPTSIKPGEYFSQQDTLLTYSLVPDRYTAELTLTYDTPSIPTATTPLFVGKEDIQMTDFTPKETEYHEGSNIVEYKLSLVNLWNGQFDNLKAHVKIDSAESTSKDYTILPFGQMVTERDYIDLGNLGLGEHNGTVTLSFGQNQKEYPISLNILPVKAAAVKQPQSQSSSTTLFIVVGAILVILVLVNMYFILKRKNEKQAPPKA